MKLDDLRIYCQNEEDQLCVVSFLEENFPDIKTVLGIQIPQILEHGECLLMNLNQTCGQN